MVVTKEAGVGSTGLGLLLEEHRGEIVAAWRDRVQRELGVDEPALSFAVAPLLRELVLSLDTDDTARRSQDAWKRCAVLVRSTASGSQIVREMKLLRRCTWEALRARGAPVTQGDRGAVDAWMDDALAEALERLERVRLRVASLDRPVARPPAPTPPPSRVVAAPRRVAPPPLPTARNRPVVIAARRTPEPEAPLVEAELLH